MLKTLNKAVERAFERVLLKLFIEYAGLTTLATILLIAAVMIVAAVNNPTGAPCK